MKLKSLGSISLITATTIALFTAGCGGGGGSSSTTPVSATSTVTLSGTVVVASSSASGAVGTSAVEATSSTSSLIEGAVVTISSFDKAGTSLGETVVSSTDKGNFTANLPLSNSGGYVVITSHKEGFINFSRRVDYDTPNDINLMAEMDAANVTVTPIDQNTTTIGNSSIIKKANGKEYVLFALFKDAQGKSRMLTGQSALRRMATGDKPAVSLEIPKGSIPPDVTGLVGSLNSYDPSNPNDAAKFPGSYADSKGNKLVSVGFDFIDIKTDGGQTLGAAIKKAVAKGTLKKSAADEPYYVTRWMNQSNCENLKLGDADKNASNGYNIPIFTYSYNSGLWEQLGQGTIVKSYSSAISDFKDYTDANATSGCNANNGDYVKIAVTNKDYLNSPWNLDYILTAAPKQVCVQGKLVDQNNKDINQSIYLSFYDDEYKPNSFNWKSANSKKDGTYNLTTVLTDNNDTDRNGTISYYNPFTYESVTLPVKVGDYPNCTVKDINVSRPPVCTVEGQIKDEYNNVKANQSFYLYSSNPYMYRYGYTNADGNFSVETRCNLEQKIYSNGQDLATLNPNGTVDLNESSDKNSLVNMGVLKIMNQAPYAYGWLSVSSAKQGTSVGITVYGYDYDNDSPLGWKLYDNGVVIDANSTTGNYLYKTVYHTFSTVGNHPITLKVTDSKGKVSPTYTIGTLNVVESNRAPEITSYYADKTTAATNKANRVYARGYDLDGDPLSYTFKRGATTLCNGSTTSGSFDVNCSYTTSATDTNETITFRVDDNGSKFATRDLTVRVANNAPMIADATPSKYRTELAETITINTAVYDADGDTMNAQLYANNVAVTGCALSGTGSRDVPLKKTCSYTMPATPSTVTFRFDVSDGSKSRSTTFDVVAGATGDLDIRIQKK